MNERRLYAIVDADVCERRGVDLLDLGRALCGSAHPPGYLQVRAKDRPASVVLHWLAELRSPCRARGIELVCNDRADVARLSGADMVHVGQDDLPVSEIRRCFPGLGVGVSTHDLSQLERAVAARPDYVAFGPVFDTGSKRNPEPTVGRDQLLHAHALARAASIPLVGIGGFDVERARQLSSEVDIVAVISALVPVGDAPLTESVDEACARFAQALAN